MPTPLSRRRPLTVIARATPTIDSAVRLSLNPARGRRAGVDGAWWPRSCDADAELPALIAAVDQRLDHTTVSVRVHPDAWDHIPRLIPARGRHIQVGPLVRDDPRVVRLTSADGESITLLVVEPDTAARPAADERRTGRPAVPNCPVPLAGPTERS
ncbi:DUF5994 family protein [Spongiactinospora sp. 9N601]|uniref:DUF5994 family protein n=1 Tax=Spongiactinospora sp. 9N601 TaxID=3375149 RepID=UPI0037B0A4E7